MIMELKSITGVVLAYFGIGLLSRRLVWPKDIVFPRHKRKAERIKEVVESEASSYVGEDSIVDHSHFDEVTKSSSNMESLREFSYRSLVDATENFSDKLLFHRDHAGLDYRGTLVDPNKVMVVIRRLGSVINQKSHEFVDEVLALGSANHQNLAKLIGYCHDEGQRLLVYQHVLGGSLETLLHGKGGCVEWKTRMKIAAGVLGV